MPTTVIITMVVKPDQVDAHIARLKIGLPETASVAPGCISLNVHRDLDQPNRFVVIEQWESRQAFLDYFNWRRSTGNIETMEARLEQPLDVRAFEGPLVSGVGTGVAA